MAQLRTEYKKTTKKKSSWKKVILYTFLAFFILGGGAVAYFASSIASVFSQNQIILDRGDRSDLRDAAVNPSSDPVSVLFLGLDTRDGDLRGRTDAMVLATFNPEEGTIKMLNIPRDSRVDVIGANRVDKINHAHAFGGVDMTLDTVENLLGIPVDYFVSLNFDAFMEIIDELGGITVNSPMTFTEKDNATYGTITIHEGEQRLNGEEALAYVRMRKSDPRGDLGRGERQKEVIEAIIKEAASFSSITNFNSLMDSVERNLNTNITFGNIVSMHSYASGLSDIESLSFEGDDYREGGIYYYKIRDESLQEIQEILQVHLGLKEPEVMEVDQDIEGEEADEVVQ
ncbi:MULTISPECIES: LCP family protein [Bacillaceae]|uniref:LCP family protein n=1 Tax=Evansella alkalicola TaxID=745819 RepID=A0ABS6JT44_9BACI|nr:MULTISPECIES: LCP family protein [Bacillaceae]MBU9721745.1 LCP family protein [Bacillus alkalicola]